MQKVAQFVAVASIAAGMAGSAQAGERPFSWTGFYAGVDIGYQSADLTVTAPGTSPLAVASPEPNGLVGGGHIGYRFQFPSRFVIGLEADLWAANASDQATYIGYTAGTTTKIEWGGSVRGTAGYAFGRSLLYATGGLAWIDTDGCSFAFGVPCANGTGYGDVKTGWTIGGGLAHAFTPNLSARVEYLYADYGNDRFRTPGIGFGVTTLDIETHTVRAGLSWKFSN